MLVIAVHELDPVLKVVFHLREMVLKDLIRIATNSSILAGDPVSEIYAEERGLDPTVDQNIWCAVFLCLNPRRSQKPVPRCFPGLSERPTDVLSCFHLMNPRDSLFYKKFCYWLLNYSSFHHQWKMRLGFVCSATCACLSSQKHPSIRRGYRLTPRGSRNVEVSKYEMANIAEVPLCPISAKA